MAYAGPGIYEHYKGLSKYKIIGIGVHEKEHYSMAIGKILDSDVGYFLWPLREFNEIIGSKQKFRKV